MTYQNVGQHQLCGQNSYFRFILQRFRWLDILGVLRVIWRRIAYVWSVEKHIP